MKHYNRIFIYSFMMIGLVLLFSNGCKKDIKTAPTPTLTDVTDIDGNVYHTVTIGSQVWMVENLKTTKYRNGDPISYVSDSTIWSNNITEAYCNYNNDVNNSTTYGRLYNWYAVIDNRNIAPVGWHIPTDAEWTTLTTYLGIDSIVGGNLKETGTIHWLSPNTGATNSSGFTALPGGFRSPDGTFIYIGRSCFLWSYTENNASNSFYRSMGYNNSGIFRGDFYKRAGYSVRCLKD